MSPGVYGMEYKWVIHYHGPATVKFCWDLKYYPTGFLPSSWLLNDYIHLYDCFLLHITYVNIVVTFIMLKVLSYLFLIFLFLLSLLLALLF